MMKLGPLLQNVVLLSSISLLPLLYADTKTAHTCENVLNCYLQHSQACPNSANAKRGAQIPEWLAMIHNQRILVSFLGILKSASRPNSFRTLLRLWLLEFQGWFRRCSLIKCSREPAEDMNEFFIISSVFFLPGSGVKIVLYSKPF